MLVLVFLSTCGPDSAIGADRAESADLKSPPSSRVEIKVSVDALQVSQIQDHDEKFDAEFYLYFSWKDPRLAFDARKEGRDRKIVPIEDIWSPEPDLLDDRDENVCGGRTAQVHADGTVLYHQHHRATISTNFDLHEFPLDRHTLEIKVESPSFDVKQLVYAAGDVELSAGQRIMPNGWRLIGNQTLIRTKSYAAIGESYSQFVLKLNVQRDPHFYFWAIVLPLLPIVVTSWCVFWMSPDEFGAQAGVGITTMLTVVAYKVSIDSSLPPLAYMTRMDFFLLVCQLFVFGAFLMSVVIHVCHHLKTVHTTNIAHRLSMACRWIAPLLMAGTCLLVTLLHPVAFSLLASGAAGLLFLLCRPTLPRMRRWLEVIMVPERLKGDEETGRDLSIVGSPSDKTHRVA